MLSIYPKIITHKSGIKNTHQKYQGDSHVAMLDLCIYNHEAAPLSTQGPVVREQCWKLMAKYEAWTEQKLRKETRKDFKVRVDLERGSWECDQVLLLLLLLLLFLFLDDSNLGEFVSSEKANMEPENTSWKHLPNHHFFQVLVMYASAYGHTKTLAASITKGLQQSLVFIAWCWSCCDLARKHDG